MPNINGSSPNSQTNIGNQVTIPVPCRPAKHQRNKSLGSLGLLGWVDFWYYSVLRFTATSVPLKFIRPAWKTKRKRIPSLSHHLCRGKQVFLILGSVSHIEIFTNLRIEFLLNKKIALFSYFQIKSSIQHQKSGLFDLSLKDRWTKPGWFLAGFWIVQDAPLPVFSVYPLSAVDIVSLLDKDIRWVKPGKNGAKNPLPGSPQVEFKRLATIARIGNPWSRDHLRWIDQPRVIVVW